MRDVGVLYLIGTPIGNLKDITLRALETISESDVVFCEDTRRSQKLLSKYSISKKVVSLHSYSSDAKVKMLKDSLLEGKAVAYLADAGMPGVSDPGPAFAQLARNTGAQVTVIPGVSSVTAAVSLLPRDYPGFTFLGYPSLKKNQLDEVAEKIKKSTTPLILFVPPHDLEKLVLRLKTTLPTNTEILICRELTKKFEEVVLTTLSEVENKIKNLARGELTLVFLPTKQPREKRQAFPSERTLTPNWLISRLKNKGFSSRDIMRIMRSIEPKWAKAFEASIYNKRDNIKRKNA